MTNDHKQAIELVSIRTVRHLMMLCAFACLTITAHAEESDPAPSVFSRPSSAKQTETPSKNSAGTKGLAPQRPVKIRDWSAKFGLQTKFHAANDVTGERISHVALGTLADKLQLRPGDTIVAVNGSPLKDAKSWDVAIDRVSRLGGWLTLKVHDGKTGVTAYRTANLRSIRAN